MTDIYPQDGIGGLAGTGARLLPQKSASAGANGPRVLLVTEIFPPRIGGSGRWLWEIYRRFPRESFLIAAGEDPKQDAFDQTHNLHVVRMPLTLRSWGIRSFAGLAGYWRSIARLRRLVNSEGVEMVHCARALPEGMMALALKRWKGIPYVCYAHGEELSYAATSRELSWLLRRVLACAELVIVNSRSTAWLLRHTWNLPESKIELLHPGVDTKKFVPAPPDPALRRQLGWEDRSVILTVGRLQKRKGHDKMIEALCEVKRAIPSVLYAIGGEGEERESLRELAVRTGMSQHVQFLGEVDEQQLVRCYQQCDLFVLPNRQVGADIEGFGMVLLEAQACGKPVVAGASGGTAETMSVPRTGRVIPCEEPHGLAAVVIELLAAPSQRQRMGSTARQWAVEHFDWSALSTQAARIFQRRRVHSTVRDSAALMPEALAKDGVIR